MSKRKEGIIKMSKLSSRNRKEGQVFKQIDRNELEKVCGKKLSSYFNNYSSEELIYQVRLLLESNENLALGVKYSQKNHIDQLTIWSKNHNVGFVEICAALSSSSINIFSGRVTSLKNDLVLYTFEINRFGQSTFRERGIWDSMKSKFESNKPLPASELISSKYMNSNGRQISTNPTL